MGNDEGIGRRKFIKILVGSAVILGFPSIVRNFSRIKPNSPREYYLSSANRKPEPDYVKGIYAPGWKALTKNGIDKLMNIIKETEINTLMIDVKNARGELFYTPKTRLAKTIDSQAKTKEGRNVSLNMDYLLEQAIDNNVRLIGRHVMFWDNNLYEARQGLRLWKRNQERWVDIRKKEVLDYNFRLLREESKLGFDEIVLDYIRFPDVNKFGTQTEKCETIDTIVRQARRRVKKTTDFSVQVYGYAAWHHFKAGVGQRIETLNPNVDAIYPMLYPSHFWKGSFGFKKPSDNPYEIITLGYKEAIKKVNNGTKIIPMIQAFWYPPEKIASQIKAADDYNMPGYICWNPSGNYKNLKKALS